MQAHLAPAERLRIFICLKDGAPVSGLVASKIGGTGIYLLGATNDVGMLHKGSYLLQWRVIEWLREEGADAYDLGGIDPQLNPGVYHFKAGLGGVDALLAGTFDAVRHQSTALTLRAAAGLRRLVAERRMSVSRAVADLRERASGTRSDT